MTPCPLCGGESEPMAEGSAIYICKECAYYFVEHEWDFLKKKEEDEG